MVVKTQQVQAAVRMRDVVDRKQVPWIALPGIVVRGTVVEQGKPRPSRETPVRSAAQTAVARRERPVAVETIASHHLSVVAEAIAVAGSAEAVAVAVAVVAVAAVAELPEEVVVVVVAVVVAVAEGEDDGPSKKSLSPVL